MSGSATMNLTDAKARLSSVISQVELQHRRFVITKNNRPVAKIVPIAGSSNDYPGGSLSAYADTSKIPDEAAAFAREMEDKHAADR